MKIIVALLVLVVVALSVARSPTTAYPKYGPCGVGTRFYASNCKPKMPEATCDQPNPVMETQNLCGYVACYCEAPTVRDKSTKKCVNLDECPKKESVPLICTPQN